MPFQRVDPWDDGGGKDDDRSDFRPVPASDKGNAGYTDKGMFGSYTPSADPYASPAGIKRFAGYGATQADLARGWKEVSISDNPAYQLDDYKWRSTDPKQSDIDEGGDIDMPSDYEFRRHNRRSRGFLTRPMTPIDR